MFTNVLNVILVAIQNYYGAVAQTVIALPIAGALVGSTVGSVSICIYHHGSGI